MTAVVKRHRRTTKHDAEDEDDLWTFQSLKRTRKSKSAASANENADLGNRADTSSVTKSRPKRINSKKAAQRIKSQIDNTDSAEELDCVIVKTVDVVDFNEKRRKDFLFSDVDSNDFSQKSSPYSQGQLCIDNKQLSQSVKVVSTPTKTDVQESKGMAKNKGKGKSKNIRSPLHKKIGSKGKGNIDPEKKHSDKPEDYCPSCQVPFSALLRLSPNAHTMECMDLPLLDTLLECEDGLSCVSRMPSHYRKYKHALLAQARAHKQTLALTGTGNTEHSLLKSIEFPGCSSDEKHGVVSQETANSFHDTSSSNSEKMRAQSKSNVQTLKCKKEDHTFDNRQSASEESDNDEGDVFYEEPSAGEEVETPDLTKIQASNNAYDLFKKIQGHNEKGSSIANKGANAEESGSKSEETKPTISELDAEGFVVNQDASEPDGDLIELLAESENEDESENTDTEQSDSKTDNNFHTVEVDDDNFSNDSDRGKNSLPQNVDDKTENTESKSFFSQGLQKLTSMARKQTSLFSFFSGDQGTKTAVQSTTSSCDINELKTGLAKIRSVPVLNGRKQSEDTSLKKSVSDAHMSVYDKSGRKSCPFYKKIPDTSITVDAFRYGVIPGCKAYVLTHFHYDHYGGLTKKFSQPVYCSRVTGNLVRSKIKVADQYIHDLPLNKPCIVEGVELTLMEANHCPGAVIILFRLKSGQTYLHSGDFRADPSMEIYPPLVGTHIHQLYLDTTYCDPAYAFPSQSEVIDFAVTLAKNQMEVNPRSLIICGSYTIGKERVFLAIAEALGSKICVMRDKKAILDCLEDPRLDKLITLTGSEASVHVLPMGKLNPGNLSDYLHKNTHFTSVLALQPTGWSHSNKVISLDQIRPKYSRNGITIYGIPYSEHSSYLEMKRFTQFLRPDRILPTVNNGNPQSRKKMENIFQQWMAEIKTQDSGKKQTGPSNKQASLSTWFK